MKNEVNKECVTDLGIKSQLQQPSLYQVQVHDDDFTPVEFVVSVLETFFFMDRRKAVDVMQTAEKQGKASCGLFSKDLAETKIAQVIDHARLHEHPLICSMEAV